MKSLAQRCYILVSLVFIGELLWTSSVASISPKCLWTFLSYGEPYASGGEIPYITFGKNSNQPGQDNLASESEETCKPSKFREIIKSNLVRHASIVRLDLYKIPFGICSFGNLESIDLGGNFIDSFSIGTEKSQFDCLKQVSVKKIDLQQNKITEINLVLIFHLQFLEDLNLDFNLISVITGIPSYSTNSNINIKRISLQKNR